MVKETEMREPIAGVDAGRPGCGWLLRWLVGHLDLNQAGLQVATFWFIDWPAAVPAALSLSHSAGTEPTGKLEGVNVFFSQSGSTLLE